MNKKKKTVVEFVHIKDNKYKVHISGEPKQISGHRFTALIGVSKYMTNKRLLLDFYGLNYTGMSDNMRLGIEIEPACLEYGYGEFDYWTFEYFDYQGNVFGLNNPYGITGLPDAVIPDLKLMNENKMTTRPVFEPRPEWKKQVQFYAYWWNKLVAGVGENPKIENLEITAYYVPSKSVQWQFQHLNKIVEENFYKYKIDLESDQIEKDMVVARAKRKELIEDGTIDINIKRCKYLINGLRGEMIKNNIKLIYDQNDISLTNVLNPLIEETLAIRLENENK